MIASEMAKSIASDVKRELFEGGPGSGNWGHKGRPGHRGGSAPRGTGGGISAHVVKPGVHASTFYDKAGGLKVAGYEKLTDNQKVSVLSHGVQKYKERYVPKAKQGSMSEADKSANKKVGALEGMRRAAINKASGFAKGSKEWRGAMHVAISLQAQAQRVGSTVKVQTSKSVAAAGAAAKAAEAQPGK
jgi:hypothetical protein